MGISLANTASNRLDMKKLNMYSMAWKTLKPHVVSAATNTNISSRKEAVGLYEQRTSFAPSCATVGSGDVRLGKRYAQQTPSHAVALFAGQYSIQSENTQINVRVPLPVTQKYSKKSKDEYGQNEGRKLEYARQVIAGQNSFQKILYGQIKNSALVSATEEKDKQITAPVIPTGSRNLYGVGNGAGIGLLRWREMLGHASVADLWNHQKAARICLSIISTERERLAGAIMSWKISKSFVKNVMGYSIMISSLSTKTGSFSLDSMERFIGVSKPNKISWGIA